MMEVKLFDNYQDYLAQLPSTVTEDISSKVTEILEEVRNHGDSALKKLTYRFDGIELDSIRVQPEDFQSALQELDPTPGELIGNLQVGLGLNRALFHQIGRSAS